LPLFAAIRGSYPEALTNPKIRRSVWIGGFSFNPNR
jgi:hypothetical protein